jgi:hypothetical protein
MPQQAGFARLLHPLAMPLGIVSKLENFAAWELPA